MHLAELEAEGGQREVAIERLRRIVSTTEDPEPAGLLGELLLDSNPAEAAGFIEQARGRYNDLLARHPAAFADHGSEFFSGPGNEPQRALELALANLERRPTERAYTVAIEVAHSAGEANLACELAQRSGTGSASVVLKKLVQSILDDC